MTNQPYLHNGNKSLRPQFKRPNTVPKPQEDPALACDHTWKRYKKNIEIDHNPHYLPLNIVSTYKGGTAYFVVRGCEKCKKIEYLNYHIS